jgi:hypothetical protein
MKHFHIAAIAIASALFTQPSLADSVSVQVNRGNVSVGIDVGTPPPAPLCPEIVVKCLSSNLSGIIRSWLRQQW